MADIGNNVLEAPLQGSSSSMGRSRLRNATHATNENVSALAARIGN